MAVSLACALSDSQLYSKNLFLVNGLKPTMSSMNKIEIAVTHQNLNSQGSVVVSEESQVPQQGNEGFSDNDSYFELGYKEGKESVFSRFCEIVKVPVSCIYIRN